MASRNLCLPIPNVRGEENILIAGSFFYYLKKVKMMTILHAIH